MHFFISSAKAETVLSLVSCYGMFWIMYCWLSLSLLKHEWKSLLFNKKISLSWIWRSISPFWRVFVILPLVFRADSWFKWPTIVLLLSFCFLDFSFVIFTFVFGVRKMINGFARQFLRMDTNGPSDQVGKTTSPVQILWLFEKLSSKALMLSLLFRCWNSQKMVKVWSEYWAMCY